MNYSIEKHAKTLELDRILERLADEATMPDAKREALRLKPMTNIDEVRESLKATEDAYLIMARHSAPSFGSCEDITPLLTRAQVGAALSAKELLSVAEVLRIIRNIKSWRESCSSFSELSIDPDFDLLYPNKFLEDKINFAIKSEEEINDNASPLLYDIRRKIAGRSARIREDLEKIIRGSTAKYLQDAIITQRDGRFVVPVKAEHKGDVKGIVHDTSSTGSTFFVEPMSVVENNNEIRVLKIKEQEEIARILAELSAGVADFSEGIRVSFSALVRLNLIFAKAHLAYKMHACVPNLNNNGYIYLKRARHPMIDAKKVVPVTVELGGKYKTMIITGPNTGGKTVTLKTIGLLTLMAMCGLMIPVDDNSEVSVFTKIFADIGDEQSIEQSLSTFSSHMANIIKILNECDADSLVLFDELCAGTDPIEGAALAKAILMKIYSVGAKTVATTHYAELKSYALDTDGVENASCEFDVESLKPTYRLIVGVPGRSNAFAISKRLGLSDLVIESAKNQVSEDELRFERVVESLETARRNAEEEQRKVSELRAELESTKRKSDMLSNELRINREKVMQETREKARTIIENARSQADRLLNELEEIKKDFTSKNAAQNLDKARAEYRKTLKNMENEADPIAENKGVGEKLKKLPLKGDIVVISDFGRDATVLDVDEKGSRVFVMSGSMKMWVKLSNLSLKKSSCSTEIKKTRNISGLTSRAERKVSGELDIRGMASDEGILELDKYLDNAVLSGIQTITVIHGKGTGALRKAVHAHLRGHKLVKGFRVGTFGEGENGVTIVELKE